MHTLTEDFRHGDIVPSHCHAEAQLIHATRGVMLVVTEQGNWVIPTGHALWVPAGVAHEVRMTGAVSMRTLLVPDTGAFAVPRQCQVLEVGPLLRELIVAAADYGHAQQAARLGHLMPLILLELSVARQVKGHVPLPDCPRLRTLCTHLLDHPDQEFTLEQWGTRLNMSSRTLARLFQRELGMSFGEWRIQARMVLSQRRLADGASVLEVALEHGYQSASAFAAVFKRTLGYSPSATRSEGCPA